MIHNLMIRTVEFRDENDPEICKHTHDKAVETLTVHSQPEMTTCYQLLYSVLEEVVQPLLNAKVVCLKRKRRCCHLCLGAVGSHGGEYHALRIADFFAEIQNAEQAISQRQSTCNSL